MLFRQIIPIFYIFLLFTLLGCTAQTPASAGKAPQEAIRTVILIQKNDVKLVDLSDQNHLRTSLSELMVIIVGKEDAKQAITSLSDPEHPFFTAKLLKNYQESASQADFDLYEFKKKLLFDFAEAHDIYLQISNISLSIG